MKARIFGDIAAALVGKSDADTTRAAVRRHSYREDTAKANPWTRFGGRDRWRANKGAALGAFDRTLNAHAKELRKQRAERRRGTRESVMGPDEYLHEGDRSVLIAVLEHYNAISGKCFPALTSIVDMSGRSHGFVVASLKRLRSFGFIDWVRRTKVKEGAEGQAGPQLEQTSNAYFFPWLTSLKDQALGIFKNLLTIALKKLRSGPAAPAPSAPTSPDLAASLARMEASIDRRDAALSSASTKAGDYPEEV